VGDKAVWSARASPPVFGLVARLVGKLRKLVNDPDKGLCCVDLMSAGSRQ
jgi:hypothetical protein